MNSNPSHDLPVGTAENVALLTAATLTTLLFYLYMLGAAVALLVVLAVELILMIAAMRVGAARLILPAVQRHVGLAKVFFRSLWPRKEQEMRVPITQAESPKLGVMLKGVCERAQVPMPRKVVLEMGVNAWVNLKGWRAGRGMTTLGIGYDLIAGLTQAEMEAVLAHEMMHAKLVQRGFRQLITRGVDRAARLTGGLSAHIAGLRQAKKGDPLAEILLRGADMMTRHAARQVAACSRQDEFAADRGAAKICGAGAIRSSLLKLREMNAIASRLPLRDRVAHLESEAGFSRWLVRELAAANASGEVAITAFNHYSTHPSLHDRLGALADFPEQEEAVTGSPPAIELLANPDEVAEKLVAVIQRVLIANEERDNKVLDRWSRRAKFRRKLSLWDVAGWAIGILFLTLSIAIIYAGQVMAGLVMDVIMVLMGMAGLAAVGWAVGLLRAWRFRDRISLPVPDYGLIREAATRKLDIKQQDVREKEEQMGTTASEKGTSKARAAAHLARSYAALAECDYVTAHIAARLCLREEKKSIPGHLALAVAAGGIKNPEQARKAVLYVQQTTGMKGGESLVWGAGWALLLVGDFAAAEAFLKQALKVRGPRATLLALVAVCQSSRGKLFSAISSARKALVADPQSKAYGKLLIELLLAGGFLREAAERLAGLEEDAREDEDLMFAMVRLHLSQEKYVEAEEWVERVRQRAGGAEKLIRLGNMCLTARLDARAAELYREVLTMGHYPEALLGLANVEVMARNRDQAREYLIQALNLESPAGEGSVGAVALGVQVLQQLRGLRDPVANCKTWIATMPRAGVAQALAGVSFIVCAVSAEEARQELEAMLAAMTPGTPPVSAAWTLARKEQQPAGLAHPGVQGVM
jgi:heat shock protein HtpX